MAAMSRRGRKQHVQQELFRRGGKRKGAGRKPKGARAGASHKARPLVRASRPLHVTLRVVSAVGNMRRRALYKAMRDATVTAAVRERIRIVHLSIQRDHVHLLVEADDKQALSRGLQGFQISVARNVNTVLAVDGQRRRGSVFADRYHAVAIASPTQAHRALTYVLCNWKKHGEDQQSIARSWLVDPFSSAVSFPDWLELDGREWMWRIREGYDPLIVRRPQSWVLAEGWKLVGAISARDVPGRRA